MKKELARYACKTDHVGYIREDRLEKEVCGGRKTKCSVWARWHKSQICGNTSEIQKRATNQGIINKFGQQFNVVNERA